MIHAWRPRDAGAKSQSPERGEVRSDNLTPHEIKIVSPESQSPERGEVRSDEHTTPTGTGPTRASLNPLSGVKSDRTEVRKARRNAVRALVSIP